MPSLVASLTIRVRVHFSKYHEAGGGDTIWQISTGYFGCRKADGRFDPEEFREKSRLDQIKMIEIKLSQGAKPGHGGMLMAPKVTPEIAETRGFLSIRIVSLPRIIPSFLHRMNYCRLLRSYVNCPVGSLLG